MKKQDFYYELPAHLIAQFPQPQRRDSRLLVYSRQTAQSLHQKFSDLPTWLEPGDLLVLNDSRVIPARVYGRKASGGQVELLVERVHGLDTFSAHIKASKAPKPGGMIYIGDAWQLEVLGKQGDLYQCRVQNGEVMALLHAAGHIPLPPYITRADEISDIARYQTVYARHDG